MIAEVSENEAGKHGLMPTDVDHLRATICQSRRISSLLFINSRLFYGFSSPRSGR